MTAAVWGWTSRLSLQHIEMDATHLEFVSLCAALADKNAVKPFVDRLDELIEHTVRHFEQENAWMREHSFPPAGCHEGEHNAVLELIQEVRRRYLEGEHELGERLAEELPFWFEHHVDTMDNMLARFLNALESDAEVATPALS